MTSSTTQRRVRWQRGLRSRCSSSCSHDSVAVRPFHTPFLFSLEQEVLPYHAWSNNARNAGPHQRLLQRAPVQLACRVLLAFDGEDDVAVALQGKLL
jgi:hypothetical protein